jgi:hypothetical protein
MIWIVALQRCLQDGLICHNNLANCNISWRLISATKYLIVTLQMFCYKVLQWNNKKTFSLGANCLICNGAKPWGLDLSRSRLLILTSSNSSSQEWRKSWHFQKVCLDSQEILIEIKISQFSLDINVRTQKSHSRNASRSGNFIISWKFVSIWIEKLKDFCIFLVKISQFIKTFHHFHTQNVLIMSRFLNKSRFVLTNLENLDVSRQSRQSQQKSWQDKVSNEKSWF